MAQSTVRSSALSQHRPPTFSRPFELAMDREALGHLQQRAIERVRAVRTARSFAPAARRRSVAPREVAARSLASGLSVA